MILKVQKTTAQPVKQTTIKQQIIKEPYEPVTGGPTPYEYDLDPIVNGGGGGVYNMTGGLLSLLEESETEELLMSAQKAAPQMIQMQPQVQQQQQAASNIDQEKILFLIFGAFIGYALTKLL